jgi:hypothetical protein
MRVCTRLALTTLLALGATRTTLAAQAVQTPTITVSGVGYLSASYQLRVDSSLTPAAHGNNFDVVRSYVNVLGKFADGISTRVTIDVDGRKAAANEQAFRLKYAYVAWQPGTSPLTIKLGAIQTPLIEWEEALWEYRMQGVVPLERAGYITSSDFGISVDGMWRFEQVNAQIGVYNGEGYNNALGDNRKDVSGRLSVRLARSDLPGKVGGLRLTGYANIGRSNGGGVRDRALAVLSYKTKAVTLAAELGFMEDSTSAATPHAKGRLMAAYGVVNLPHSKVALIGRIDAFDPNTDSTAVSASARLAVNRQTRVIAGASYTVSPNLRFLVDADLNSVAGGSPTNSFDRSRQQLFLHTEFKF